MKKNTKVNEMRNIIESGIKMDELRMQVEVVRSHNSLEKQICEIVQGSLDANAEFFGMAVDKIGENLVQYFVDNGDGMGKEEALNFKNFAKSNKTNAHIGKKGLGVKTLYNCQKVLVYTRKKDGKFYLITMHQLTEQNYQKPTVEELSPNEIKNNDLLETAGIKGIFSEIDKLENGTIIITVGNPCFEDIEIKKHFNTEYLKRLLLRKTHLGSDEYLKGLNDNSFHHDRFPKVEIKLLNKERKVFYAYKRLFNESKLNFGDNKFDFDEIKDSFELCQRIKELQKLNNFLILTDCFKNFNEFGDIDIFATIGNCLVLGHSPYEESTKRDYRQCKIGKDFLPTENIIDAKFGLDDNIFQNYTYIHANYQGFELNMDRSELIKDNKFNFILDIIKHRINLLISQNMNDINKIQPYKMDEVESLIKTKNDKNTYFFDESILNNLPDRNVEYMEYQKKDVQYTKHVLLELNKKDNINEFDFRVVRRVKHNNKKFFSFLIVDNKDYNSYVQDVRRGLTYPNMKFAQVNYSLSDFFSHKHDIEKVNAIICSETKGFKPNKPNKNGFVLQTIQGMNGKYFLTKGDLKIPVYVLDEICMKLEEETKKFRRKSVA